MESNKYNRQNNIEKVLRPDKPKKQTKKKLSELFFGFKNKNNKKK
jgi:hypothetical protein